MFCCLIQRQNRFSVDDVCNQIVAAVRAGNAALAAAFVAKDMKKNGIGSSFSKFHLDSLVGNPG